MTYVESAGAPSSGSNDTINTLRKEIDDLRETIDSLKKDWSIHLNKVQCVQYVL